MSTREEFDSIAVEIIKLNNEIGRLSNEKNALEDKNADFIFKIIEEEKLLANTKWKIILNANDIYLNYTGSMKDEAIVKLLSLISSCCLTSLIIDNVEIDYDDRSISIMSDSFGNFLKFINRMGLIIDHIDLQNKLKKLKNETLQLETILHQLKLF